MAQIKKLQQAGTIPTVKKIYGTYNYGTKAFPIDDELISKLEEHFANNNGGQAGSDILKYIKSSNGTAQISYDRSSGEVTMPESAYSSLNQRQIDRNDLSEDRTIGQKIGSGLGEIFGGKVNDYKKGLASLRTFNPEISTAPVETTTTKPKLDFSNTYDITYTVDDKGKKIYSPGFNNSVIEQRLTNFFGTDYNNLQNYDVVGLNIPDDAKRILFDRNKYTPQYGVDLLNRLKTGTETAEDKQLLSAINIGSGVTSEMTPEQKTKIAENNQLAINKELNLISAENKGYKPIKLENGRIHFPELKGKGPIIADEDSIFAKSKIAEGNGSIIIDGTVYSSDDFDKNVDGIYDAFGAAVSKAKNTGDFSLYTQLGIDYGADRMDNDFNEFDPTTDYLPGGLHSALKGLFPKEGKMGIRDATGNRANIPAGKRMFQYQDNKFRSFWGKPTIKSVLFDPITQAPLGTMVPRLTGITDMSGYPLLLPSKQTPVNFKIEKKTQIGDTYYTTVGNLKTKEGVYPVILDKFDQEFLVINGRFIKVSKELHNKIVNKNYPNLTTNDFENKVISNTRKEAPNITIKRRDGGVIRKIIKSQRGGLSNIIVDSTPTFNKESVRDTTKSANIADIRKPGELTGADKAQLASLLLDLGSLVISIPTGGNPAAAGLGIASSMSRFGADVSRDGFQMADAGSFAMNLGLDAITTLPGLGVLGKTAKVVNTLRKGMNWLGPAFAAYGLVQAGKSLSKLNTDEKLTLDDMNNILMGVRGVVGMGRSLGTGIRKKLATSPSETSDPTMTFKNKNEQSITLTKQEVDDIRASKKPNELTETLFKNKLKAQTQPDEAAIIARGKDDVDFRTKVTGEDGKIDVTKGIKIIHDEIDANTKILDDFGVNKTNPILNTLRKKGNEKEGTVKLDKLKSDEPTYNIKPYNTEKVSGLFPNIRKYVQNKAIRSYTNDHPDSMGKTYVEGTSHGIFTGKEYDKYTGFNWWTGNRKPYVAKNVEPEVKPNTNTVPSAPAPAPAPPINIAEPPINTVSRPIAPVNETSVSATTKKTGTTKLKVPNKIKSILKDKHLKISTSNKGKGVNPKTNQSFPHNIYTVKGEKLSKSFNSAKELYNYINNLKSGGVIKLAGGYAFPELDTTGLTTSPWRPNFALNNTTPLQFSPWKPKNSMYSKFKLRGSNNINSYLPPTLVEPFKLNTAAWKPTAPSYTKNPFDKRLPAFSPENIGNRIKPITSTIKQPSVVVGNKTNPLDNKTTPLNSVTLASKTREPLNLGENAVPAITNLAGVAASAIANANAYKDLKGSVSKMRSLVNNTPLYETPLMTLPNFGSQVTQVRSDIMNQKWRGINNGLTSDAGINTAKQLAYEDMANKQNTQLNNNLSTQLSKFREQNTNIQNTNTQSRIAHAQNIMDKNMALEQILMQGKDTQNINNAKSIQNYLAGITALDAQKQAKNDRYKDLAGNAMFTKISGDNNDIIEKEYIAKYNNDPNKNKFSSYNEWLNNLMLTNPTEKANYMKRRTDNNLKSYNEFIDWSKGIFGRKGGRLNKVLNRKKFDDMENDRDDEMDRTLRHLNKDVIEIFKSRFRW